MNLGTRQHGMTRFLQGLRDDLRDYQRLRDMLSAQFDAALHYRTQALADLADQIVELTAQLDLRRTERVTLVRALVGQGDASTVPALFETLPPAPAHVLATRWDELEQLVLECKTQNMRNCHLMVAQNEIMQRILNTEAETYAPG